jgi:benzylsuccinate CoA-transferase BbsF subunit
MTISAVTGLMWSTAYRPGDPVGPGTHYPDHAANPYHAAFAILAALRRRRLTGEGMRIDLSQVESTINFIGTAVTDVAIRGSDRPQSGNASPAMAPHGVFRCAGDDEWCALAVASDAEWQAFVGAAGMPELSEDPRFATASGRIAGRKELERRVAAWFAGQSADDAARTLRTAGVPAARVADSRFLVEDDPQLAARAYWQRVDHPELGRSLYSSPPYRIDGERVELGRPPLLGEHTREVLGGLLGLGGDEIDRLETAGVFR